MAYQTRSKTNSTSSSNFDYLPMRSDDAYYCYLRLIPFHLHLQAQLELGPNPFTFEVLDFIGSLDFQEPLNFDFYATNRVDASLYGLQAHVTFTSLEEGLPPTELLNLLPKFARVGYKVTPLNVVHAATQTTKATLGPRNLLWLLIALALCYWTVQPQSHQIVANTPIYPPHTRKFFLEPQQENLILQFSEFPLPLHLLATATNISAAEVYDFLISKPQNQPAYLDTYSYCWTRAFPEEQRLAIAMNYPGFVSYTELTWIYLANVNWQPVSLTPGHLSLARVNLAPLQLPILLFLEKWLQYCILRFFFSRTIPVNSLITAFVLLAATHSAGYIVSIQT